MHPIAVAFLLASPSSAVAPSVPRQGTVPQDLRYVDADGGSIDLAAGAALPGGRDGCLRFEVPFRSDAYDPVTGQYQVVDVAILWRMELGGEDLPVRGSGDGPEDRWCGVDVTVSASVLAFDSGTGQGLLSVRIPVGIGQADGSAWMFPYLPEGAPTLYVHAGWEGALAVDDAGEAEGELVASSFSVPVEWPEVWVGWFGEEGPRMWSDEAFVVAVRDTTAPRELTVEIVPEGAAVPVDATLSFAAGGDPNQALGVRALSLSEFRVVLRDGGAVVATSRAVQGMPQLAISPGPGLEPVTIRGTSTSAAKEQEVGGFYKLYQECHKAKCLTPGKDNTLKKCGPCGPAGESLFLCKGEGTSEVFPLYEEGECTWAWFDACKLVYGTLTCNDQFKFVRSETVTCFTLGPILETITSGVHFQRTCCFWRKDASSSGQTINVVDCQ